MNNSSKSKHRRNKITKKKLLEALEKSGGLITFAAEMLNVDRTAIYKFLHRHPELQEDLERIRERMLDLAESKLYEKIKDGDTAAIFFYLKCLGKRRGYIERQEYSIPEGESIKKLLLIVIFCQNMEIRLREDINESFIPFFNTTAREAIVYGGAGAGKSFASAQNC